MKSIISIIMCASILVGCSGKESSDVVATGTTQPDVSVLSATLVKPSNIVEITTTTTIPTTTIKVPATTTTVKKTTTTKPKPTTTSTTIEEQEVEATIPPTTKATGRNWDAVAKCESGGNWSINTGNGFYGGLQFSLSSWRAVGGTGYPHQASKAEQINRAEKLLAMQGRGAWPHCGKFL